MILAAIVVTHNRRDHLAATLERLLAEPVEHVLVVDNASTDGTGDWLATQADPRLAVVGLSENTGGAGGFEAGMEAARARFDPDWMVLMDDDARPLPGALARFRDALGGDGTDPDAVAAAVFHPDGRIAEMNRPSRNPFWQAGRFARTLLGGGRAGFHLSDAAYAEDAAPRPIDVASFVGYFVSKRAIARAGLPEGGLFIYGDDVLYSLRLRRAGLALAFWPAVRFEHDCATMGADFAYRPLWKIYYHCRNGVAIARQAAGPVIFPAALAYYVTLWWRRGRRYDPHERRLYRQMMWAGLRDGLRGRRGRNDTVHTRAVAPAPGPR